MALFFETIVEKLVKAGIESPRLEARLMISEAKGVEAMEISAHTEVSEEEKTKVEIMLGQRLERRPLDKILGHREFYKYDFLCDESVLSPRPDTEVSVEQAAALIFKHDLRTVLDLGVGSGCIVLSLLADFPFLSGVGVDISEKALKIASKNAQRLGVENRVRLLKADWHSEGFEQKIGQKFDIIVSNPPYIPTADIELLEPEVKNYDPMEALDGGKSGFDAYEKIAQIAPRLLNKGGYLVFEAGINQAEQIAEICENNGFLLCDIVEDLSGIKRCVIMKIN